MKRTIIACILGISAAFAVSSNAMAGPSKGSMGSAYVTKATPELIAEFSKKYEKMLRMNSDNVGRLQFWHEGFGSSEVDARYPSRDITVYRTTDRREFHGIDDDKQHIYRLDYSFQPCEGVTDTAHTLDVRYSFTKIGKK